MPESHLDSDISQHLEFIGMDEPIDRQMIFRRLEVLTEGENIALNLPETLHHFDNLLVRLTDAEHHARLSHKTPALRATEKLDAPLIDCLGTNDVIEARYCFGVVIQDIRQRIENDVECKLLTFKIRNEN